MASAAACAHCTGLKMSSGGASTNVRARIDASAAVVSPSKPGDAPTSWAW
jgi:hypothetical protein